MKLKVEHFDFYDLVTVCFDYASEILRTRYRESVQKDELFCVVDNSCVYADRLDIYCFIVDKFYLLNEYLI